MQGDTEADLRSAFRRAVTAALENRQGLEAREELRRQVVSQLRDAIGEARRLRVCNDAWLFGSFAWGRPTKRSDLDIIVDDESDPDAVATIVERHTGRRVDVLRLREAPEGLFARIRRHGTEL